MAVFFYDGRVSVSAPSSNVVPASVYLSAFGLFIRSTQGKGDGLVSCFTGR